MDRQKKDTTYCHDNLEKTNAVPICANSKKKPFLRSKNDITINRIPNPPPSVLKNSAAHIPIKTTILCNNILVTALCRYSIFWQIINTNNAIAKVNITFCI